MVAAAAVAGATVVAMGGGSAQAEQLARATIRAEATAVRSAPTRGSDVRTRLPRNSAVEIKCQTSGETTQVEPFGASSLWDFLPAYDGWVSHVLIETAETVPACRLEEKHGLLTKFRDLASGRLDIRVNPFALTYGDRSTYYAESRMAQQTGKFMPVYGQPYQWAAQARLGGWTVGSKPEANAVAVFPRNAFGLPDGHVGWVTEVKGREVRIQDYDWNGVGATVTDHWVQIVPGTQFVYADR